MKIVTHPDNVKLIRELCEKGDNRIPADHSPWGIDIVTNKHLERTQASKTKIRFKATGKVLDKANFKINTRFVSYGPEDLRWLLFAGIVEEVMEPLFYVMNDFMIRSMFDFKIIEPRHFVSVYA